MGIFGSFEDKVRDALKQVAAKVPGVRDLDAVIEGKMVTLKGVAPTKHEKVEVMTLFNQLVETERTMNALTLDKPPAAAPVPPPTSVVAGAPGKPPAEPSPLSPSKSAAPPPAAAAAPEPGAARPAERRHVVAKGETLSAIAKQHYGKASLYTKIFEANRDLLNDPDKIQVGQTLRIPD